MNDTRTLTDTISVRFWSNGSSLLRMVRQVTHSDYNIIENANPIKTRW